MPNRKKISRSLKLLQERYRKARETPGTIGFHLSGIKPSQEIQKFLEEHKDELKISIGSRDSTDIYYIKSKL